MTLVAYSLTVDEIAMINIAGAALRKPNCDLWQATT